MQGIWWLNNTILLILEVFAQWCLAAQIVGTERRTYSARNLVKFESQKASFDLGPFVQTYCKAAQCKQYIYAANIRPQTANLSFYTIVLYIYVLVSLGCGLRLLKRAKMRLGLK